MLYRLSYQVTSVLFQNVKQYIIFFRKINPEFEKKQFFFCPRTGFDFCTGHNVPPFGILHCYRTAFFGQADARFIIIMPGSGNHMQPLRRY